MKKNLLASSLAVALGLCPLGASAALVTFDLSTPDVAPLSTNHGANYTLSSGGYTLFLTNPTGGTVEFVTDQDGLYLAASGFSGLTGFNLSLDVTAKIVEYSVSFVDGGVTDASFDLSGGRVDGPSSTNNSLLSTGTFALSAPYILNAGQAGTFSSSITGSLGELHTITIDTNVSAPPPAVPEPSTLALLLAPLALGWSIKPGARGKAASVAA